MTRSGKPDPECEACEGSGALRIHMPPGEYGAYKSMGGQVVTRCPCTDTHDQIDTLTVQEETHPLGQRGVPEFHEVKRLDGGE